MTPERIEQERNAFEGWFYENICGIQLPLNKSEIGRYCNFYTEDMFTAWCAAKSHAEQSEWISVKDRLPESSKRYLTFSSFYMRIVTAYYSVDRRMWLGVCRTDGITHWQPFPAPPTTNPAA
ncbi:hypothetical protein A7P95_10695 [Eikenella longinqua]|uniref:DUF551 domain-containing protein n=1 Tax=Eikenella longinqua TaxID=1795827 RepID=A0A1A9RUN0_9NEIS|nr:hypothetical protein A7P95_10695 [Eikenella longinqua]